MEVDTIVARATAAGPGAVALVRLSGPGARQVAERVAPGAAAAWPRARTALLTEVVDPDDGRLLDRALLTWFPGPASYTGEDVVEIAGHGGWLTPELVVEACVRAGARPAEAGEFTRRAYLHGKMDLVQVEAVADLVDARSRAMQRAALVQLDEGLSNRIAALREALLQTEAMLAHHVDFPEEDDAPVPVERIRREAGELLAAMDGLLATAPEGARLREGAVVVIAGEPNAGKSSLYNALLGEAAAIVTEIPGTTRDTLEAVVELRGYPFRLVDTAGLRETDDPVEREGVARTRRALERADLVLHCVPATGADGEAGAEGDDAPRIGAVAGGAPVVTVRTKADLAGEGGAEADFDRRGVGPLLVSARTGQGLDALQALLPRLLFDGMIQAEAAAAVLTRPRQAQALREARAEVDAFAVALREGVPAEMASTHLRAAESALESLVGVVTPDEVLGRVFASFCVGK